MAQNWKLFEEFLRTHKEFTYMDIVMELYRKGVSPNTVYSYIHRGKKCGLVRVKGRQGRTVILESLIYAED